MKKKLLIIIGNLFLSGIVFSQNWTKSDIDFFVEECILEAENHFTKNGALEYCNCSVEKVMKLYPDVQLVENLTEEEINFIALECVLQISETEDGVALSWDEETKKAFIENCEIELQGSGINAQQYCACALEEVIILYPNPLDSIDMTPEVIDKIALKCLE